MDVDTKLVKSFSIALKKEIKYICMANRITKSKKERIIFCLGEESFHIIDDNLKEKSDYAYETIETIILDRRNTDQFFIIVNEKKMFTSEKSKLQLCAFPRDKLIKNFMCYYSILYMFRYAEVRDLKMAELLNESKKQLEKKEIENKKGKLGKTDQFGKYKMLTLKKYCFYVKHTIVHNYNNNKLKIKYIPDEKEQVNNNYFSDSCDVNIDISDVIFLNQIQQDDREMSFYAFNHFSIYMRNTIKSTNYWILKNNVYQKNFNLQEDKCSWDGWIIECRTSDPYYSNLIFIYFRRKFLPPFFDRFINAIFILTENCSKTQYNINPKAHDIINTMANTLCPENVELGIREYKSLLECKFEGLLYDEETYYYFQNILKIYGKTCYLYGFAYLIYILNFLDDNLKEKEKISPLKAFVELKKKSLFGSDSDFAPNDLCKERLNNILNKFLDKLSPQEDKKDEEKRKLEAETTDGETKKLGENHMTPNKIAQSKLKKNWKSKVLRFLCYCVNGGLTDFNFTFETFLNSISKCQTNIQEFTDFIYKAMDIEDLDANEYEGGDSNLQVSSLTDNSNISFNEEIVAVCIKSGWLSKTLSSESTKHCPNLIKLLLTRNLSNKILYSVCEFLKSLSKESQGDGGGSDDSERREYSTIIGALVSIFSNTRNCPILIVLACKSLCALVSNENDYKNRLILIQNEIVSIIAKYLEERFDEKMVLCLLELLFLVLPDTKLAIVKYLYNREVNLMHKLSNLLDGPGIAGTFFSIRTYVKIITIFLSLSNIHQADLRMELNKDKYKEIYGKILRLLDEKNKIYDPSEEMSYVLEYKIYYLLSILIFKNLQAQEILIEEYKLLDIIDEKCAKYFDLMNMIINSNKNKKELAQQKIESLVKTISKFYEMITYLLSGERGLYNKERIKLINVKNSNFSNLYEILTENDNFVNKYETFRTSYVWIKKLLRSIETDENI